MKTHVIFLVVMGIVAASCSVENETPENKTELQEITIRATREDSSNDTRTIRTNDGTILWTPGDQISVFYGSGKNGGSCFTAQNTENERVTNFTGTIGVITGGADVSLEDTYFWGLYPYDPDAECGNGCITTTIKNNQTATAGTFASNLFPSVGRSQGLLMAFYNICGGIKFTVKKDGIKRAILKTMDGSAIAGKVRISIASDNSPILEEIVDGKDEIILSAPEGETFIPGESYFFCTLPHKFSDSFFTITFETDGETGTYERKRALEIKKSDFIAFTAPLDGSVTYSASNNPIHFADSKLEERLIAKFDTDGNGELSYAEAAAVTDITDAVTIKTVTSFNEFKYFTGVTEIPENCFQDWKKLASIILPQTISTIGDRAFSGCTALQSIELPESVSRIGHKAFINCPGLKNITESNIIAACDGTATLKDSFAGCTGLTSVIIPNKVKYLWVGAFEGCSELSSVYIPESVIQIQISAFNNCENLSSINFPDSISLIGSSAFHGCKALTAIALPKSLTELGGHAFADCSSLQMVSIPESISSIPGYAFTNCSSLSIINLPESVSVIGGNAFYHCTSLSSITIPESVSIIGDSAFEGCGLRQISIPESVSVIYESAFRGCINLESIIIDNTTPPSIGDDYLYGPGYQPGSVFSDTNDCPIHVPGNAVETYKAAAGWSTYADRIISMSPTTPDTGGNEGTGEIPIF